MNFYPLFFLGVVSLGWGMSLFRGPIWALVTYIFIYFNIPSHQWWGGQVPYLRWSLIAAIVMLLSSFIHSKKLTSEPWFWNKLGLLLLGFLVLMIVITPFTPDPARSWNRVYDFFRYVFVFFLINKIIVDFNGYRIVLTCFLFCTFYLSVLSRHYFQGSRLDGIGLVDASDANMLAALVLLILPLYVVFMLTEKGWRRILPLIGFIMVTNMFIMCASRGAFVGFIVQCALAIFLLRGRIGIWKSLVACLLVVGCMYLLMSPQYKSRLFGLEKGLQSKSVNMGSISAGRTEIWQYGLRMFKDFPMGAGGGAFQAMSPRYIPDSLLSGGERASHNTYLLVLVEQGIFGLLLFLYFLFCQFAIPVRLFNKLKLSKVPLKNKKPMYHLYAIIVGIAGFWSAAFFIDRLYFEGIYLVVALIPVLIRLLAEQVPAQRAMKLES